MRIYFKEGDEPSFTDNVDPNNLPEELKTIYKNMQADYTRKTQELAERRKAFDEKESQWETKLQEFGAAVQERDQWRQWYASIEADNGGDDPAADPALNHTPTGDEDGDAMTSAKIAQLEKTIQELQGKLGNYDDLIKSTQDRTGRMFAYHTQLSDILRSHPEVDRDKLVKHAVDKGFTDLEAARQDLYHDDIINAEVEKRLEERLKEERAKHVTGTGRQVVLKPRSEGPKSYGEATQSILDQKAADGSLDLGA